jgi:hypothetical protein
MKKGLLSILAGALVVVGCQNYDDQFDQLESQINALASTVAGLSAVQSDLASLSAQVNSLSGAVDAAVDAALAGGLADIQAAIDALNAAAESAANNSDITQIAEDVDAVQDDLTELLAQSSVFTGDVTVTSQSTLDAYLAMGKGLNIVNGNVTITPTSDMNQADVQALVDNIITVVKDVTYTAPSSDYEAVIFDAITGVQTITLKQGGSYDLRNLVSAEKIVLNDQFKSTVTLIHLGALTQVGTIQDDNGTAGTIKFNKAEEFHLTSLPRYPGNNLNIQIKEGGILAMGALTDLDADGTAVGAGYTLTIDGPASLSLSNISDGTISLTNVATADISGFIGTSDINAGVVNLTLTDAVAVDIAGAADLETATISGALDSDPNLGTADTAGPDIVFASQDLITATISGIVNTVNATSQSNLETITVSADFKGGALVLSGNGDLVTVDVTGAKIGNVTFDDNDDMETLVLNHTTSLASTDKAASIVVTNNLNLTDLTLSADKVDVLNVSVNAQLETVDFTGLATIGTATSATVDVKQNKLTASLAKDSYQAATAADAGSYTSTSGLKTLKTYLAAAKAAATKDIEVYFDILELVQTQASATANFVDIVHTNPVAAADYVSTSRNAVLVSTTTPASGETVRETTTWVSAPVENSLNALETSIAATESVTVTLGGVAVQFGGSASVATVAQLVDAIDGATNWGSAYTVTAAQDAYKKSIQTVNYLAADGSTAATVHTAGNLYYSFGSTVTGTIALTAGDTNLDIVTALASAISGATPNKWNASVSGNDEVVIYNTVSVTGYPNELGTGGAAFPTIAFTVDAAQTSTTAVLSSNASNTAGAASRTYFLNVQKDDLSGIRVTAKNNSTSSAGSFAIAENAANVSAFSALASGTNTIGTFAQIAAFTDVADATPASTSTTDRLGWL